MTAGAEATQARWGSALASLGEDGGVQSEPLRGGGRSGGVGAAAQEPAATGPGGEKESERGRSRRRLIPLGTWSRWRAELGLERLQPPAKVSAQNEHN